MGKNVRSTVHKELSANTIANILSNNPSNLQKLQEIKAEEPVNEKKAEEDITILSRDFDYDSLHPIANIRNFVKFLKSVKARYEENTRQIKEFDDSIQDLLHYVEMGKNLSASKGYAVTKKIAEIRRERRKFKNENALLKPVYDYILESSATISKWELIQGDCHRIQTQYDNLFYTVRTDVIKEISEKKTKEQEGTTNAEEQC